MNIYEKLSNIQNELKCNKNQFNNFGGYKYRSCEDILEAVKPICKKYNTTLILSDEIVVLGESTPTVYTENYYDKDLKRENAKTIVLGNQRYYIKATATLYDTENNNEQVWNMAYAREEESKKGMDGSQITGTASSYARKYALNGLFNIDDTKDADTDEYQNQIYHQDEQKINKTKVQALKKSIENNKLAEDFVQNALNNNGFEKIEDITNNKYLDVVNELRKGAE